MHTGRGADCLPLKLDQLRGIFHAAERVACKLRELLAHGERDKRRQRRQNRVRSVVLDAVLAEAERLELFNVLGRQTDSGRERTWDLKRCICLATSLAVFEEGALSSLLFDWQPSTYRSSLF